MVRHKLSVRRLLVTFGLLMVLACVHFFYFSKINTDDRTIKISSFVLPGNHGTTKNVLHNYPTDRKTYTAANTHLPVKKKVREKAWYFNHGIVRPTKAANGSRVAKIWPWEATDSDRIVEQLMYVPPNYTEDAPMKNIFIFHGIDKTIKKGQDVFLELKCPVNRCSLTDSREDAPMADAIIFKDHFVRPAYKRPPNQVWILYLLECPYHTQSVQYNDLINWTATYRRDSEIVTPYEKWVYYDDNVKENGKPLKNYAANKTRQVAWFVSNCGARNGRLRYAQELQKYITVDIYGACGSLRCPRSKKCFQLLDQQYKFYLAFENSNCRDYITEKFFVNGLQHDVLPIVMGAPPEDYAKVAPPNSYIHVDDFDSPKHLAEFLHKLDNNTELYNTYFRWKGTGEFINTRFFCRVCAMLHDEMRGRSYTNINRWWKAPDTCIPSGSWKNRGSP